MAKKKTNSGQMSLFGEKKTRRIGGKRGDTVKRASKILKDNKSEFQKIFKKELRNTSNPKVAAKRAGTEYRSKYGATRAARWKKALREAKK